MMKKTILLAICSHVMSQGIAQWTPIILGPSWNGHIADMHFVNKDTAYALQTNDEVLFKTMDGWQTWTNRYFGGSIGTGLFFLDADTGYIFGEPSISWFPVIRTDDGGQTFTNAWPATGKPNAIDGLYYSVDSGFINTGYNLCSTSTGNDTLHIYDTVGMGIDDVIQTSDSTLFVVIATTDGLEIWRSNDLGRSWTEIMDWLEGHGYHDFTMVNDSVGYALLPTGFGARIYKTEDGGYTWNWISTVPGEGLTESSSGWVYYSRSFCFLNEDTGLVGTEDSVFTKIYRTVDGGETWELTDFVEYHGIERIMCNDANDCWLMGSYADSSLCCPPALWHSTNLGGTWTGVDEPEHTSFAVSPNPTHGPITINLPLHMNDALELTITNTLGQQWKQKVVVEGNQHQLDLTAFASGIYIIALSDGEKIWRGKVVKQ